MKILTSNLASPFAAAAQTGGSIIGGGAGVSMASHETLLGRYSFKGSDNVSTPDEVVVGFLLELTSNSRSRFNEPEFICDLGIDPQSETSTVIFKFPAMFIEEIDVLNNKL